MGINGNGNGAAQASAAKGGQRRPRRIVLLAAESDGPVEKVLAEYQGAEVSGNRLHADLHRLSEEHPGQRLAAEWLGTRGWTRFLWRRK
jgi:hypothetical protein